MPLTDEMLSLVCCRCVSSRYSCYLALHGCLQPVLACASFSITLLFFSWPQNLSWLCTVLPDKCF